MNLNVSPGLRISAHNILSYKTGMPISMTIMIPYLRGDATRFVRVLRRFRGRG
jgi:hypothetical protein